MKHGIPSTIGDEIDLLVAETENPALRETVLAITHTAFLINPETGLPIEGDTPTEVPMVRAMFERDAVDYLHVAQLHGKVVAYVLYSLGSLTENPGLHVEGLTIMGVLPELQRQGIGTRLLLWSVQQMTGKCDALFVVGHPGFYPRAGFRGVDTLGISFSFAAPKEACLLVSISDRPLLPGIISYHPIVHEFWIVGPH